MESFDAFFKLMLTNPKLAHEILRFHGQSELAYPDSYAVTYMLGMLDIAIQAFTDYRVDYITPIIRSHVSFKDLKPREYIGAKRIFAR